MGRPKISFAVGKKRKASELVTNPTAPAQDSASKTFFNISPGVVSEALAVAPDTADSLHHTREAPLAEAHKLSRIAPGAIAPTESVAQKFQSGTTTKVLQSPQRLGSSPTVRESRTMAEPPAKRAKRTDSSAMWDRNERPSRPPVDRDTKDAASGRDRPENRDGDRDRGQVRDDRRHRSRSRDRVEKRRERSRSRARDGGRYRNGDKGRDGRDRRDRERTTSRERRRPRRGRSYGSSIVSIYCYSC